MNTYTLTIGKKYTPEKGKPPIYPCRECAQKDFAKFDACNKGFTVCPEYMEYEECTCIWRQEVFN